MSGPFHSPAPWQVNASGGARTIVAADRSTVAVVVGSDGASPFEPGNGSLLAAAPALFEELHDAAQRCATLHGSVYAEHTCATCKPWRAALAKAVGP